MIGYLLGLFPPGPALERLEERVFMEDRLFDRLVCLEDALIDAYVGGFLASRERRQFETVFLASPRRRRKWEARQQAAAGFRARKRSARPAPGWLRPPALATRFAWAATCVLLAGCIGLLTVNLGRTNRAVLDLREKIAAQGRLAPAPLVAFVLAPGQMRSAGGPSMVTPGQDGAAVRLLLPEPGADSSFYEAALSNADGVELWKQSRLPRSSGNSLLVRLPASVLTPGDYVLSLREIARDRAWRALRSYTFRVPKGS